MYLCSSLCTYHLLFMAASCMVNIHLVYDEILYSPCLYCVRVILHRRTTSCSIILVYHRFVLDFRHQTNTSFRAMPTYEPGIYINRLNVLLTHLRTRVMPEIIIITLLLLSLKLQHIINLKNLLANNWYWYVTSPSTLFVMVRLWLYSIVWCWLSSIITIRTYWSKKLLNLVTNY